MSTIVHGKAVELAQIPNQRLFKAKAAAQYLGISDDTLTKYVALGYLKAYALYGRRMFKLEELDALIEKMPEWDDAAGENPRRSGKGTSS